MTPGIAVLLATLALAAVVGLALRARDGRLRRGRSAAGGWDLAGRPREQPDRVLLLQLSSPVCQPCRQTAALLTDLARRTPGVVHTEIDVADRPEVARTLGIMRTPTVVAFDRAGAELLRLSGVPRPAELTTALASELERA